MSGRSPSRAGHAVVTGAGKRLGAAFARALAADGWAVRLHCHASRAEAEALAGEIARAGGRADVVQADLTAPDAADIVFAPSAALGPATLLVNNASLFEFDLAGGVTAEAMNRHYAANAVAPVLLSRRFAALLPAGLQGLIVNMLDQKLTHLNPDFFSYTMSKAALEAATIMTAQAFAPRIRVNAIAPGITLPSADQTEAEFQRAQTLTPLGRGGSPDDLAAALRYLIAAEAVTGQTMIVDAGQHLFPAGRDLMFVERGEG